MKRYNVVIDDVTYIASIEEIANDSTDEKPTPSKPKEIAKPKEINVPAAAQRRIPPTPRPMPTMKKPGAANAVYAPMPGTIVDIRVHIGQEVAPGDILCVLDAMKMENNIQASVTAVIKDIPVKVGHTVTSGTLLVEYTDKV